MLSLRSSSHTFHARLAIGSAFQNIKGRLTAAMTGLALKAINSDAVGSASGKRFDTVGGGGVEAVAVGSVLEAATSSFISTMLAFAKRSSRARSSGSRAGSYSSTRLAQS